MDSKRDPAETWTWWKLGLLISVLNLLLWLPLHTRLAVRLLGLGL